MKRVLAIGLLFPTKRDLAFLLETTETEVFNAISSNEFNENGLFSTNTFGVVGSEERYQTFSYKELGTKIIHPRIFKYLLKLDRNFERVIKGEAFYILNKETGEFEHSDIENGRTGISFFIESIEYLSIKKNESKARNSMIDVIEKHLKDEGTILIENLFIIPAGMREYLVNKDSMDEEDEINEFYRSTIRLSNYVINANVSKDELDLIDPTILNLQKAVQNIYDYIWFLMDGKKKKIRSKWLTRNIDGGTYNVLSSIPIKINDLNDEDSFIGFNDTIIGLYQFIMANKEIVRYELRRLVLSSIINEELDTITGYDLKTLKPKTVNLTRKETEAWMTVDGLYKTMSKLKNDFVKDDEIIIHGHYMLLVSDTDEKLKLVFEVDDETDMGSLRPITYGELFMIIANEIEHRVKGTMTRFPVTTQGSTYLTHFKIYSTVETRKVEISIPLLGGGEHISKVVRFPIKGKWYNTIAPHYTKLKGLGADFDGDHGNTHVINSKEGVDEVNKRLSSLQHYIRPDGTSASGLSDAISELVIATLTKG